MDSNLRVKRFKGVGQSLQVQTIGRRIEIYVHGGGNRHSLRNGGKCSDHYVLDFEFIKNFNYRFCF